MTPETARKAAYVFSFLVISIAVVGYFVGLQSPMNPVDAEPDSSSKLHVSEDEVKAQNKLQSGVVPATSYADMPFISKNMSSQFRSRISELTSDIDLMAEITIDPEEKQLALEKRQMNRAFNGAPPTIPHPIEQRSANSCMICHENGAKTATLRISKMSHQFLANCTQCHVESAPTFADAELFQENTFVGLPAPTEGPRAYEGAPPMIPHSTWMRVECSSCHGPTGLHGIRSTHPWRQSCQQCHAPSSKLEQLKLDPDPKFLPPLEIE